MWGQTESMKVDVHLLSSLLNRSIIVLFLSPQGNALGHQDFSNFVNQRAVDVGFCLSSDEFIIISSLFI